VRFTKVQFNQLNIVCSEWGFVNKRGTYSAGLMTIEAGGAYADEFQLMPDNFKIGVLV